MTSELHLIPPVYGIPLGFIRQSTNGWGHVAATHSSFEAVDPSSSGQPVAVVFCLCALAMAGAALLEAARTFRPSALTNSRVTNRLPAAAWVGGSGGLVLAGTVAGIRAERLPQRPLDLPYGIVSQYGSALWLAAAAAAVAVLVCWADVRTRHDAAHPRADVTPGADRGVAAAAVAGIVAAALAGAAALATAYSVRTSAGGSVLYRFAASGAITRVNRPPAYSDLGGALDDVRAVDYRLPLGVAGVIALVCLARSALGWRRGRPRPAGGLAVPGLFLGGLLAAQLLDDHALTAQLRQADASLTFTVGWASWLTGGAAALSLATWALAAHPEWFAGRKWPRGPGLDELR